ncbi:MAG: hypothetical protein GKR89_17745 [Candidatus Latescibacteria bacterium]|nr:hypothetical protein [Candidatus Latescibacterota bacterium]
MESRVGQRKRIAPFFALSLLLHSLFLWTAELYWREAPPPYPVRLRLKAPPELRPFVPQRSIPIPRQRPFSQRPRPQQPRDLQRPFLDAGTWLLQDGIRARAPAALTLDSIRQTDPALPEPAVWEHALLASWRDSLDQLLEEREKEKESWPLSPFELAIKAAFNQQTAVLFDADTGRLEKAYWYVPVYGEETCVGCLNYNAKFKTFKRAFENIPTGINMPKPSLDPFPQSTESWQPVPLLGTLKDGYSFNATGQSGQPVQTDAVHSYSHPRRDVLGDDQMRRYPVLLLQWIDPASAVSLARYLGAGGFALVDGKQLDIIQTELVLQEGEDRVRRIKIWSDHPLMAAYYPIELYHRAPRQANTAPLEGLELEGRLVAVARLVDGKPGSFINLVSDLELFINAVVFGLVQPSALGGRYHSSTPR